MKYSPYLKNVGLLLCVAATVAPSHSANAVDYTWSNDFETATAASAVETLTVNNGWGPGFYNNAISYNSVTGAQLASHGVNFNTYGSNHGVVEAINNETVGAIIGGFNMLSNNC